MVAQTRPAPANPPTVQNCHDRLIWIEAQIDHLATRAWVLGGVVGGMVAAAGIATGIALIVVRLV